MHIYASVHVNLFLLSKCRKVWGATVWLDPRTSQDYDLKPYLHFMAWPCAAASMDYTVEFESSAIRCTCLSYACMPTYIHLCIIGVSLWAIE